MDVILDSHTWQATRPADTDNDENQNADFTEAADSAD